MPLRREKDTSRGKDVGGGGNQAYPAEAAQELALALAGDGDGRRALLELAGLGVAMGLALAVLLPLAPVLLHHVELGHESATAAAAGGCSAASLGGAAAKRERETSEPFRPQPLTLADCLEIRADRYTWQRLTRNPSLTWRFVQATRLMH